MSKWVTCDICGEQKEVPAFEGDGVYHEHYCQPGLVADDKIEDE